MPLVPAKVRHLRAPKPLYQMTALRRSPTTYLLISSLLASPFREIYSLTLCLRSLSAHHRTPRRTLTMLLPASAPSPKCLGTRGARSPPSLVSHSLAPRQHQPVPLPPLTVLHSNTSPRRRLRRFPRSQHPSAARKCIKDRHHDRLLSLIPLALS